MSQVSIQKNGTPISRHSPSAAKIALFQSLFRGREDALLQQNGYFVLRFLAGDAGKHLDDILDSLLSALVKRQEKRGADY